jgi:hypothetical protein
MISKVNTIDNDMTNEYGLSLPMYDTGDSRKDKHAGPFVIEDKT